MDTYSETSILLEIKPHNYFCCCLYILYFYFNSAWYMIWWGQSNRGLYWDIAKHLSISSQTRAKSPQPQVDREETREEDEDQVRLDPCKSLDNTHHLSGEGTWSNHLVTVFYCDKSHEQCRAMLDPGFSVVLTDDSHLHFEVGPGGACGQPRFWARFPLLWSGCRAVQDAGCSVQII